MHYLKHHIGDLAIEASRMTNGQELAHRRMIDLQAKTESPLPLDVKAIAFQVDCPIDDVEHVLRRAWSASDDGYRHGRTWEQVAKHKSRQDTNKRAAQARWGSMQDACESDAKCMHNACKSDASLVSGSMVHGSLSHSESEAPAVPPSKPKKDPPPHRPDDVSEEVWQDWLTLRRAKKAPVTTTALKRLRSEADKAGLSLSAAMEICAQNGWQGFLASYVADKGRGGGDPAWRERFTSAAPEEYTKDVGTW